jgi:tRNA(Ile)-lysidine synthase
MASPIGAAEFTEVFAACGPFEPHPLIAVAVSGGADSMALLHLLVEWAGPHEARLLALTVDHGLRQESAAEARQVGAWAAGLNIEHLILPWSPEADKSGGQDGARQARYQLMNDACTARGILHLAVAHHRNDQAETFLLRLAKGSGIDGLACMQPVSELSQLRVLRPLLNFPRARLQATCRARRQDWCEDPTNRSEKYARPRLRVFQDVMEKEGFSAETLSSTAARLAGAAAFLQAQTAKVLAETVTIFPQAYAALNFASWQAAPPELRRRSLGQVIRTIGNEPYLPPLEQIEQLLVQLGKPDFKKTTLGNCLLSRDGERLLIERETRHLEAEKPLQPGWTRWDRFEIFSPVPGLVRAAQPGDLAKLPAPVRASLALTQPAIVCTGTLAVLPTLGYFAATTDIKCRFSPRRALTDSSGDASFPVV